MSTPNRNASSDLILTSPDAATRVAASPDNGGRLTSLRVGDLELLGRGGTRLIDWGCYPMAPFAGRIRGGSITWQQRRYQLPRNDGVNAIHGFTLDRPWEVLDHTDSTARLRCHFDSRWPWRGWAEQHLEVRSGRLEARLEVHAHDEPMPAWCGYHPWFARQLSRGGPAELHLAHTQLLPKDEDGMPQPNPVPAPSGPWDDVFVGGNGPCSVRWPGAAELQVSSNTEYLVVFDELPDALCLEPQTAPPNATELGLASTVTPGQPLILQMRFEVHLLTE